MYGRLEFKVATMAFVGPWWYEKGIRPSFDRGIENLGRIKTHSAEVGHYLGRMVSELTNNTLLRMPNQTTLRPNEEWFGRRISFLGRMTNGSTEGPPSSAEPSLLQQLLVVSLLVRLDGLILKGRA